MRLACHCVLSTAHLPVADRDAFDKLIADAPRRAGRLIIDHPLVTIEAHQFGFAIHLGICEDDPERPEGVSQVLWGLMRRAGALGADWLWFDRDEPPRSDFPVFTDEAASSMAPTCRAVLCEKCRSADLLCDASVRWDEAAQDWAIVAVLDPAWCDHCGDTHRLEIPDGASARCKETDLA